MLVERAGFSVVHISGSSSHRSAGFGDVGLLTLTEQAARATMIADSVSIPVIADADTGFGNAISVVRTVREFERAGVAGIHIEDQFTPKRGFGEASEGGFIPLPEFVGKIGAAVDTRIDPNFIIIARMDARGEPYERSMERAHAVTEAGADALWMGVGRENQERFAREVGMPMVGIVGRQQSFETYEKMGYRVAHVPGVLAQAACWGIDAALHALKDKGSEAELFASLPGMDDIGKWFRAIGTDSVKDIQTRYMGA
jgi:2-methylisocitrate lyase-like PEP mutase family enzyme